MYYSNPKYLVHFTNISNICPQNNGSANEAAAEEADQTHIRNSQLFRLINKQ